MNPPGFLNRARFFYYILMYIKTNTSFKKENCELYTIIVILSLFIVNKLIVNNRFRYYKDKHSGRCRDYAINKDNCYMSSLW